MSFSVSEQKIRCKINGKSVSLRNLISIGIYHRPGKKNQKESEFQIQVYYRGEDCIFLNFWDEKHGIMIPLKMFFTKDTLRISIDAGAIVETDSNTWRLMEISVLPELLFAKTEESGFYLLPNYSGMLTSFNKSEIISNRDHRYPIKK